MRNFIKKLIAVFQQENLYKEYYIFKSSDVEHYSNNRPKEDYLHLLDSNGGKYTHMITILENVADKDDYYIIKIENVDAQ